MRASEIVSFCDSFFNPCEHFRSENCCYQLGGIIKILSYILIIPMIVVVAVGLHHRKLAIIETRIYNNLHNFTPIKVQNVYQKTQELMVQWDITQKDLVNYLVDDVTDIAPDTFGQKSFQKGFALLDFDHQKLFFERVIANNTFELALKHIPRDIEELNITSGNSNRKNGDLILKHLGEFDKLNKLSLDFRGMGFFGPGANRRLAVMATNGNLVLDGDEDYLGTLRILGKEYSYIPLDTQPLLLTFKIVRDLLKKNPQLDYDIDLMNIRINKYTHTGRSTFDEAEYALTIADYMSK